MPRARFHLLVLAFYLLLSLLLTYPLVLHLTTHVIGSELWAFDEYTFVWDLWWFKHALLVLQQSPLSSDLIFYPVGINLALFTLTLFNGALALPLLAWLPLPLGANLVVLFSFVMSAYGAFLLARRVIASATSGLNLRIINSVAITAGLVYAFSTGHFVYAAIGHYNVVGMEWLPFCALYLMRALDSARTRNALIAGIFLALALYVEMFFSVFLAVLIVVYVLVDRSWRRLGWLATFRQLATIALTAGLLFLPVLAPALAEFLRADYALKGWGGAQQLSVDLLGFVSPSALSAWAGLDWNTELLNVIQGKGRFADVNTVFLGYATLVVAIAGAMSARGRARVWVAVALVSFVLALGPLLQIGGVSLFDLDGIKVNVPLPFILFHYLPIFQANRVPNRFSVILVLSLAMLVAHALTGLGRIVQRPDTSRWHAGVARVLFAVVPVLLIADHLVVPLPLSDARIPAIYQQLGSDPADYTILQLPLGWRNSFGTQGAEDTRVEYYQSAHQKHILAGNTSRNPPFKFDYFASLPIVSSLIALETYKTVTPEQRQGDRAFADEFVRFFDLRYVVVQSPVSGRHPYDDTRAATLQYLLDVLPLDPISDADGVLAYRVRPSAQPAKLVVDFGEPSSRLYRGEGWDREEEISGERANWSNAARAQVFLPVAQPGNYRLTLAMLPFAFPGAPSQTVTPILNGKFRLLAVAVNGVWNTYTVDVPAEALHAGLNDLTLEFAYARAPRDVLPGSDDPRTLSAAVDWLMLEPR